jgi:hypothetical protein
MTAALTFHPCGNADDGKKMLIDYADMRNRLSEAGYAYETKLRALEHQFEVKASDLREEYLAEVLKIHTPRPRTERRQPFLGREVLYTRSRHLVGSG